MSIIELYLHFIRPVFTQLRSFVGISMQRIYAIELEGANIILVLILS